MVSFDTIPYEVLLNIVEYMTSARLAVFACTSRRIYDIVTTKLYSHLQYVDFEDPQDRSFTRCSAVLSGASHVVDLELLLGTLSKSQHLRLLVVSLSLHWGGKSGADSTLLTALLYLLSPTLLHLDIVYPTKFTIPVMPRLQSYEHNFRYSPHYDYPFLNLENVVHLNRFLALQCLTLWDVFGNWARDLPKILGNLGLLRVLRLSSSVRTKHPMLIDYDARLAKTIVNAILPVKATLEELTFNCFPSPGSSRGCIDSLHDFPRLKRVDLPYFWLMWDPFAVQGDSNELKTPEFHSLLPENLQHLRIQIPTSLVSVDGDDSVFVDGPADPETELVDFGERQKNHIPSLSSLTFYGLTSNADNDRDRRRLLWFLTKKNTAIEMHRHRSHKVQHCKIILQIMQRPDQAQLDSSWIKTLT